MISPFFQPDNSFFIIVLSVFRLSKKIQPCHLLNSVFMLSNKQMKVNFLNNIYKNRYFKKGLEVAANNGALFSAGTALTLSTVARPISIYATPHTDKENRKFAVAKSFASSLIGFGLMLGATLPMSKSMKKIDANPDKYLKKDTINALKDGTKKLTESKGYQFATQMFKLGTGAITGIPKAVVTCALIPPIMALISPKKQKEQSKIANNVQPKKGLNFTGALPKEPLTKGFAKILNNKNYQSFANKHKDSNYPMHLSVLTDTLNTAVFMEETYRNKKINEDRKRVLAANAGISTGMSIVGGYTLDKVLDKPTKKFIKNFREANKGDAKLEKYVEGIKIAKPALILGGIYYCIIPFFATLLAEQTGAKKKTSC